MNKHVESTQYVSYHERLSPGAPNPDIEVVQRFRCDSWRDGNELPNWRGLITEGVSATTQLTASRQTAEAHTCKGWSGYEKNANGSIKSYMSSNRQGIFMAWPNESVPGDLVTKAYAESTSKAYEILNRLLSEFSGQVFLGELRETKNLLKNPFKQSLDTIRALLTAKKVASNVASSWLQFQFGIKPLLNDIDAISKMIQDKIEKKNSLTYRSYGQAEESSTSVITGMYDIYGFVQRVETTVNTKAECVTRFGISREYLENANSIRTDWLESFTQISQLPTTAWELLPYSWLVDYVVNISDLIQAATTASGQLTYVSRSQIKTIDKTQVGQTLSTVAPRYVITSDIPRVFHCRKRDVARDGAPLAIPPVVWSLPGSNIKYLNIAALLVQLNSRRSL